MITLKEKIEEIYKIPSSSLKYRNNTEFDIETVGKGTYGELTKKGVDQYISLFRKHINKDCVFYDLGSGLGKMVIQIGLQCNIKKSIGIEYSKERSQCAFDLKEKYAIDNNDIEFYCKSFLDHDLSDATLVYMDNTCYPYSINEQIYNKLSKGCVLVYKKPFKYDFGVKEKVIKIEEGLDRTYNQTQTFYLIKE